MIDATDPGIIGICHKYISDTIDSHAGKTKEIRLEGWPVIAAKSLGTASRHRRYGSLGAHLSYDRRTGFGDKQIAGTINRNSNRVAEESFLRRTFIAPRPASRNCVDNIACVDDADPLVATVGDQEIIRRIDIATGRIADFSFSAGTTVATEARDAGTDVRFNDSL